MCTLIVSFHQFSECPVVVAANRDEALDRPAIGPFRWPGEPFVAPRDEQAHGTWLGLTRGGMFVGVTNRYPAEKYLDRESRGTLVLEALRMSSAEALHRALATTPPKRFNAFHLLYADQQAAFVTWSDGEVVRQETLKPGLHVVTERSLGGDDHARTSLIQEAWPKLSPQGRLPEAAALEKLLGTTRSDDSLGGLCVEVPAFNYGTRSSMILYLAPRFSDSRLRWADGRPDRTPFVERGDLLKSLEAA